VGIITDSGVRVEVRVEAIVGVATGVPVGEEAGVVETRVDVPVA